MNKFIKSSIIFSAPIFIFLILIEILLRNIPNDYSYKKNYLDKHSNEIEVLFLGSSHVNSGINPEYIHYKSFNAAHIAQSLDYDVEILKKYEEKYDSLKYIIVPIDYFSLYNRLETGIEKWRIKNYNLYYDINKSNDIKDNYEILNGKFDKNIIRIVKFYGYNKSDITSNKFGWGTNNNSKNKRDLVATGKMAAKRHTKKDEVFFNDNVAILNEIISIAKSKKIKVLFFTSPAYKTYVSQLEPNQLHKTITTASLLANSNANVKYYNFLNNKSFIAKDFYDADHLNEIGAKKFSIMMDSIIRHNK